MNLILNKTNLASLFTFTLLLATSLGLSSCKGGTCAAVMSALEDADSDCVADSGDNCPLIYNPSQFDGDEDGMGYTCDVDDGDDSVGPATLVASPFFTKNQGNSAAHYIIPRELPQNSMVFDLVSTSCSYYLVGCDDQFLGYLNPDKDDESSIANPDGVYGDFTSDVSITNETSFFGRSFTSCSAFNPNAKYPPVLFCESTTDETIFAGYLTDNPLIPYAISTCDILADLGIISSSCE